MTNHHLTVTDEQRELLLKAMRAQLSEDERYLLNNTVPAEPKPHHTCCTYHRAEYDQAKLISDNLVQRRLASVEMIEILERA